MNKAQDLGAPQPSRTSVFLEADCERVSRSLKQHGSRKKEVVYTRLGKIGRWEMSEVSAGMAGRFSGPEEPHQLPIQYRRKKLSHVDSGHFCLEAVAYKMTSLSQDTRGDTLLISCERDVIWYLSTKSKEGQAADRNQAKYQEEVGENIIGRKNKATKQTVSTVLMTEREAKQMPIYFVSRALRGPELNYTSMEKLVLALVLSRPEVAGRLQKWSIELGEYAIHYRPRVSVKGQILADFIVERPEEDSPDTPMEVEEELPEPWILFTDGSSCTDGSGVGLILTNPEGMEFTYALRFRFDATNNEAEYEALIVGLRIVEQMSVKNLQENVDSRLVANQVNRTYVAKEADMIRTKRKSISGAEILAVVEEEGDTWMTPVFEYLTEETLPADEKKARAVRRKSQRFAVFNGMHAGTRSVVAKAFRIGYYWPTMHKDARALIKACQECQVHKPIPRNP
ncbi:reverse transcriptase domain-containing protein [Tanacetum coccineum]